MWFGGYVCDLCGGYRGGGQQRVAVRVTTLFAGSSIICHLCVVSSKCFNGCRCKHDPLIRIYEMGHFQYGFLFCLWFQVSEPLWQSHAFMWSRLFSLRSFSGAASSSVLRWCQWPWEFNSPASRSTSAAFLLPSANLRGYFPLRWCKLSSWGSIPLSFPRSHREVVHLFSVYPCCLHCV